MGQKIKLEDKEYDVENLSDQARVALQGLEFATTRVRELINMKAVLRRAKLSYLESLKKEMISDKAGFLFNDE